MFWISILACQTSKTSETDTGQKEEVEDSAILEADDIEVSFPSFDICSEQTMSSKPGSFACSEISVRSEMAFAMVRVGQVEGEYIYWRVPLIQNQGKAVFVTPMLLNMSMYLRGCYP